MTQSSRQKLVKLGASALADLLVEIASDPKSANSKVQRAISSKSENVFLFKQKLKELVSEDEFISWNDSDSFAHELSDVLEDIKKGASSPEAGLELVADFFRIDDHVFERVDDSSGCIGDVFVYEALDLFSKYASQIKDKSKIISTIVELVGNDNYGVRGCLLENAHNFFNRSELRLFFDAVQTRAKEHKGEHCPWSWKLTSIAKQMKDAPLFERLTRELFGDKLDGKSIVEIASVYFESGDVDKAQSLIDGVPDKDSFSSHEKAELQKKILRKTKKIDQLADILMREFRSHYSEDTLKELLAVVGGARKNEICREAIDDILKSKDWDPSHAEFLIYCRANEEAETYLLKHANSFDGDRYYSLLPIAKSMGARKKYLVASLIYRALLNSILARAKSKYYHHGAEYFQKLGDLSHKVSNWSKFSSHSDYVQGLKKTHARKPAFWSRLETQKS
jgi:hypothetical protein